MYDAMLPRLDKASQSDWTGELDSVRQPFLSQLIRSALHAAIRLPGSGPRVFSLAD
jgi:hypothetical protein